jgi:hypothetical protein
MRAFADSVNAPMPVFARGKTNRRGCRDVRRSRRRSRRRRPQTVESSWCITTRRAPRPARLRPLAIARSRDCPHRDSCRRGSSPAERPDKKVLLTIAVDIGPTWRCVTWVFDPDRNAARLKARGWLELGGAADAQPDHQDRRERLQCHRSCLESRKRAGTSDNSLTSALIRHQ